LNEILKTRFSEILKASPAQILKAARLRQNFKECLARAMKFKNFIKENDGKKRDFT